MDIVNKVKEGVAVYRELFGYEFVLIFQQLNTEFFQCIHV